MGRSWSSAREVGSTGDPILGVVGSRSSLGLALHGGAARPTTNDGEGPWKCSSVTREGSMSGAVHRQSSRRHRWGRRADGEGRP
jgi:hypothetical protein